MNAPKDKSIFQRLRGWWASPPRRGVQRMIVPWEYRHLRGFGITRMVGGAVATAAGAICLASGADGWAVFFLVIGALDLAGGFWYLTIARSKARQAPVDAGSREPSHSSGVRRLIPSWEYRHLRTWAGARIVGGIVLVGLGALTLAHGSDGWAAFWLALAALALAGGYWEMTVARSDPPRN